MRLSFLQNLRPVQLCQLLSFSSTLTTMTCAVNFCYREYYIMLLQISCCKPVHEICCVTMQTVSIWLAPGNLLDCLHQSPNGGRLTSCWSGHLTTGKNVCSKSGAKKLAVGIPPILPSWHVTLIHCYNYCGSQWHIDCQQDYFRMCVVLMQAYAPTCI